MKHIPRTPGIYRIVNATNGKFYVGSTEDLRKRALGHFWALRNGKHCNVYLQAAWVKYGAAAFRFEIIEHTEKETLRDREQFHIDALRACDKAIGYNLAGSVRVVLTKEQRARIACKPGRACSEETKQKIAAALRGQPQPSRSDKHKAAIAAAHRGKHVAEETKQKIRAARAKQDPASLTRPHTEECKARMSEIAKRRPAFSPEHCSKISAALTGRKYAYRKSTRAYPPFSEEHRRKLSISIKAAHARRRLQIARSAA